MTGRISIIIRAKNGHELTAKCIDSIHATTTPESYRIILVDDGSLPAYQDDSPECGGYVPPVEYLLRSRYSKGAVSATNLGLGLALQLSGDYILILDNDTEIPAGDMTWLERFVREIEEHPRTAAIGATTNFAKGAQHALAAPVTFTANWQDEKEKRRGVKDNPEVAEFVSFAVLLRKQAVAQVGFWDERYNPGNFEDTDYAVQLRISGWEVRVARSVYIHHRGHSTFGSDIDTLLQSNGLKFIQKWGPGQLWDLGLLPTKQLAAAVKFREGARA